MESLSGCFLVASPHLPDANFYRSVVFMIHHDENGALGVVLNRPTDEMLSDELPEAPADMPVRRVNLGGPVSEALLALHGDPDLAEREVLPGVYLSSDPEQLCLLAIQERSQVRIFRGYAGWGPGQLEDELEMGGWLVAPATAADVFSSDEELWKRISHGIGLDILRPMLHSTPIPDDPSLN